MLRHFVLGDEPTAKPHPVGVFTDDERPLVLQDGRATARRPEPAGGDGS